jgi:hypothetical protein
MKRELELQSTKDLATFLALEIYKARTWKHIRGGEWDISGRDLKCSDEGRHYICEKCLQFRAGPRNVLMQQFQGYGAACFL